MNAHCPTTGGRAHDKAHGGDWGCKGECNASVSYPTTPGLTCKKTPNIILMNVNNEHGSCSYSQPSTSSSNTTSSPCVRLRSCAMSAQAECTQVDEHIWTKWNDLTAFYSPETATDVGNFFPFNCQCVWFAHCCRDYKGCQKKKASKILLTLLLSSTRKLKKKSYEWLNSYTVATQSHLLEVLGDLDMHSWMVLAVRQISYYLLTTWGS